MGYWLFKMHPLPVTHPVYSIWRFNLILCKQFVVEYEIQQDKKSCSEFLKTIIIIYFLCEVTVEKYEVKQLRGKVLQSCFLVTSFFAHISQQTFICPALFLSFSCKELSDMKRLVLIQTYKGSSLKSSHFFIK